MSSGTKPTIESRTGPRLKSADYPGSPVEEKNIYLRVLLCGFFYYSGLIGLAHILKRRLRPHLVILNYHEATGGDLRKHLRYLRKYYRIEHCEDALEEFYGQSQGGNKRDGIKKRDARVVLVMTFDDGYYDNYSQAFPIAKELQVPITIFLTPGYIESGQRFWWNEAKNLDRLIQIAEVSIEGQTYQLNELSQRKAFLYMVDARARYASTVVEREQFLEVVHRALGVANAYPEEREQIAASWEELKEMEASGWVSYGAHTVHHPFLGFLKEEAEVQEEVIGSRRILEQKLGHPVRVFAYPGGQTKHIGQYGREAARAAGFEWAVTTIGKTNASDADKLMLRRIEVNLKDHWLVMAAKTVGILDVFLKLRTHPVNFFKEAVLIIRDGLDIRKKAHFSKDSIIL